MTKAKRYYEDVAENEELPSWLSGISRGRLL